MRILRKRDVPEVGERVLPEHYGGQPYLYHVTTNSLLRAIAQTGLVPGYGQACARAGAATSVVEGCRGRVFFSTDWEKWWAYYGGGRNAGLVLLRVPVAAVVCYYDGGTFSYDDGEAEAWRGGPLVQDLRVDRLADCFTVTVVPPDLIEAHTKTGWLPVRARALRTPGSSGLGIAAWDPAYGQSPAYARDYARARVPVRQIASPFMNPVSQARVDELAELEDAGYDLPPVIVDGPGEVEEVDYPEEKYPFLDGHYPEVGEDVWYVHDGHHRVMLAIQQGRRFVDALVMG